MPPSRPFSAEELIEVLRRVADSSLQQSAAINRQTAALERLLSPFEQLRHDIYDLKADRENDSARVDLAINRIATDIQLTLDNIRRAQTDVRELQRDVTGAFKLEDKRTTFERVFDRLEKASPVTKILFFVLMVLAALSGWLTHLFAG